MYFAWIHALFALILLTHKYMILFCIGVGYLWHCVDGLFCLVLSYVLDNTPMESIKRSVVRRVV